MPPFSFSDSELSMLLTLSAPVHPSRRSEFLEAVAALVAQSGERGDGLTFRLARELQPKFMCAMPDLRAVARSRR